MISFFSSTVKLIQLLLIVLVIALCPLLGTAQTLAAWGPIVGDITPTSAQIAWRNMGKDSASVEFNGARLPAAGEGTFRGVTVTGLQADTEYPYTFIDGKVKKTYHFRTAPDGPADFTFAVYGDTRDGLQVHRKIVNALLKLQPRFIINSGDLVNNGTETTLWDTFFSFMSPLTATTPYLVATGNHEQNTDNVYDLFPAPPGFGEGNREWYAYSYGGVQVIILNSTRNVEKQRDWLEEYLAAHEGEARWTVVAFHYPPFSSSSRGGTENMRKEWVPVLVRHHVDAVFLGHDHFYERSEYEGIPFIITGGGGAPLYLPNQKPNPYQKAVERINHYLRVDVTSTTMRIRMMRLDGTVGDDFSLTKPAAAP